MDRRKIVLGGILGGLASAVLPSSLRSAEVTPNRNLNGPRQAPLRGPAQFLVVLCHGSGGDGPDMFGLVPALQPYLPTAAFVSPTGPYKREDIGYRWFPGALGDDPNGMVLRGVRESAPIFNAFVEVELTRNRLTPDRLILLGFSQGAMMVLNVGVRRANLPAAIVSFAGARVATEGLPKLNGAPPVMMLQGAQDGDQSRIKIAVDTLKGIGVPVQSHILPNLGHSIDARGIRLAGEFLRQITTAKAG